MYKVLANYFFFLFSEILLDAKAIHPFTGMEIPIFLCKETQFGEFVDVILGKILLILVYKSTSCINRSLYFGVEFMVKITIYTLV